MTSIIIVFVFGGPLRLSYFVIVEISFGWSKKPVSNILENF